MRFDKLDTNALVQRINAASKEDRGAVVLQVMQELLNETEKDLVEQYAAMASQVNINAENAKRFGIRQLTKEENEFYQALTAGSITTDAQEDVIPTTLVNYVFEDLRRARPLFNFIDWTPAGVSKWILAEKTGAAKWGDLFASVTDEIKAEIKIIDLEAHKLSGYSLIPQAIIELGFDWVDKYFREVLLEANEEGMEEGYVKGDGSKGPIGLIKRLTGATDGVHIDRPTVKITDFQPQTIGTHLAALTDGGKRILKSVVFVVNPSDYFKLVMPAATYLTAGGEYKTVFPFKVDFVQAPSVPENRAIMFIPKSYSAGIAKMGLYKSDEVKFLDHLRAYKIVTYGNGRIKKENMAIYFDISELKPLAFNVNVKEQPADETGA